MLYDVVHECERWHIHPLQVGYVVYLWAKELKAAYDAKQKPKYLKIGAPHQHRVFVLDDFGKVYFNPDSDLHDTEFNIFVADVSLQKFAEIQKEYR